MSKPTPGHRPVEGAEPPPAAVGAAAGGGSPRPTVKITVPRPPASDGPRSAGGASRGGARPVIRLPSPQPAPPVQQGSLPHADASERDPPAVAVAPPPSATRSASVALSDDEPGGGPPPATSVPSGATGGASSGRNVLDLVGFGATGRAPNIWKLSLLVVLVGLPLLFVLLLARDGADELTTTPSVEAPATTGGSGDEGDEPVAVAPATSAPTTSPTTSAPATSAPSTSTPTTIAPTTSVAEPLLGAPLPAADPAAPPVEPFGVYREGQLVLRGSVPSSELAEAFRQRAATVIGEENVVNEMTLDRRVSAEVMSIDVDERFEFREASVVYDADFDALLTLIAFALELLPESTLVVTGHTDSVGDEATNQALSVARAALVSDFMVRGGIPPERVVARGAGETEPIADNATPEGRQANRRIEVRLEGITPQG